MNKPDKKRLLCLARFTKHHPSLLTQCEPSSIVDRIEDGVPELVFTTKTAELNRILKAIEDWWDEE